MGYNKCLNCHKKDECEYPDECIKKENAIEYILNLQQSEEALQKNKDYLIEELNKLNQYIKELENTIEKRGEMINILSDQDAEEYNKLSEKYDKLEKDFNRLKWENEILRGGTHGNEKMQ